MIANPDVVSLLIPNLADFHGNDLTRQGAPESRLRLEGRPSIASPCTGQTDSYDFYVFLVKQLKEGATESELDKELTKKFPEMNQDGPTVPHLS